MEIFHLSAECFPVAKVGGLADVVGALPKYQKNLGHEACVIMPGYNTKFVRDNKFSEVYSGEIKLDVFTFNYKILREETDVLGFNLYIVDIPELFARPEIYSYDDDTERFLAFQIAFLNWITETNRKPDIVHCHDHHTGLIPFMMRFCYVYDNLSNTPTILTIHNGQYQGWFGFEKINYIPEFNKLKIGFLEWNQTINPLATAIKCAWKVTTVSPSYLEEITYNANGLEDLLKHERNKSVGILNGIDTEVWNPKTDVMLHKNYTFNDFSEGKLSNKKQLCKDFNLSESLPLFTFIGRLVGEKGADLLPEVVEIALQKFSGKLNILLLGSGEKLIENQLQNLQEKFKNNYNLYIGYNEKLAHQVYAAADFLLMPSRVEPCGLNQMYSLRYGTIPIVRRTGGLKDTVIDIGDNGFGICHDQTSVEDIIYSISRAIELYQNQEKFSEIQKTAMQLDHSWNSAAKKYTDVYQTLIH
ncbi:glycosyltransferase [Flavobacterium sp. NST-5]|uniref:Glycogen synthase n=1 Tax=Flavobacterium ichthyis TaxID=2698827 RepID=A0ABW9Z7V8_9FLAO|nr:glycogen synthase [Flavobacterium ichthyis]NBL64945.1 glycosyltransferase [Flavobacterium ichthyis]